MRKRFIPPQYLENFRIRTRGYLPHWEVDGAFYSITYRLEGSLPKEAINDLRRERKRLRERFEGSTGQLSFVDKLEIDRLFSLRLDTMLDQGHGDCLLRRPPIAEIVENNLRHLDGRRHELHAWCVMPNHVHVVMKLFSGRDLDRVLHSWKSYTSKKVNELVSVSRRRVWQEEYFDRIIRDEEDLRETIEHVVHNPRKAGLTNWPWVWRRE